MWLEDDIQAIINNNLDNTDIVLRQSSMLTQLAMRPALWTGYLCHTALCQQIEAFQALQSIGPDYDALLEAGAESVENLHEGVSRMVDEVVTAQTDAANNVASLAPRSQQVLQDSLEALQQAGQSINNAIATSSGYSVSTAADRSSTGAGRGRRARG
jgi:hypothetical protein